MALIFIEYCYEIGGPGTGAPFENLRVTYDDVNKAVVFDDRGPEPCTGEPVVVDGDIIYTDPEPDSSGQVGYIVRAQPSTPFVAGRVNFQVPNQPCQVNFNITGVVDASNAVTQDGSFTISTGTIVNPGSIEPFEYRIRLNTGGLTGFTPWQLSNVFENLLAGTYDVEIRSTQDSECTRLLSATVGVLSSLSATFTKQNVTAFGANDGTITLTVVGSGSYSFQWLDGPTTQNRVNLPDGIYEVTITDLVTNAVFTLSNIEITEPAAPEPDPLPTLEIPKMQSLQFTVDSVVDNCSTFENLDNTQFCKQTHPFYRGLQYLQLFNTCDSFSVQLRSNTDNITARLKDLDDNIVRTYTVSKIFEGLNLEDRYDVRFQDNLDGKTRMYFVGASIIPLPLSSGDVFSIENSTNNIDGSFEVTSILLDQITNQQYLLLNIDYNSANPTETGEALFTINTLPFNIYEFQVDFSAEIIGTYYIEIEAITGTGSIKGFSELIDLKVNHENVVVLQWANVDNAFDIDYSNNIVHRVRVKGSAFERLPTSEDVGLRTIKGRYNLLSSKPRRQVRARFYKIPPYLIEKIFIIFKNDTIRVNGMLVTSEAGLEEPEYVVRFALANVNLIFETAEWFSTFNSSDVGGVDVASDAFIIANEGFIKR